MNATPGETQSGKTERLYLDAEARDLLVGMAVSTKLAKSNVVSSLIRIAGGGRIRPGEETVEAMLKRAIGRDQFLAFLKAVRDALPADAVPVMEEQSKADYVPDKWKLGNFGILAFYSPSDETAGEIFKIGNTLKTACSVDKVYVVTTNPGQMSEPMRLSLEKTDIILTSLINLVPCIRNAKRVKKRKP